MSRLVSHTYKQRTLAKPISLSGIGLFSGKNSTIRITPASENTGIVFILDGHEIPALTDYLMPEKVRTTSLSRAGKRVRTIEHLLSALTGMFIDNVHIEVIGEDIPIINSASALDYTTAILEAGIRQQSAEIVPIKISKKLELSNTTGWVTAEPLEFPLLIINAEIKGPDPVGHQGLVFCHDSGLSYQRELAWARTFIRSDISKKIDGKLVWQIVKEIIPSLPEEPAESPIMCFVKGRWVVAPLKEDEPIRHKVLDLIGDLSLVGSRVWGKIDVFNPGHALNMMLAKQLIEDTRAIY